LADPEFDGNRPNPLVGFWQLVSITATAEDGTVDAEIYGPSPVGYITYTHGGHMMVMFSKGDRPSLSGSPTTPFALGAIPDAELAQAFAGFSAYAGTYTIDGNTVQHHLTTASLPNRVGTTLVRRFSISGDALLEPPGERLTLSTPATNTGSGTQHFELVWERR
jgi:hypothetical protein